MNPYHIQGKKKNSRVFLSEIATYVGVAIKPFLTNLHCMTKLLNPLCCWLGANFLHKVPNKCNFTRIFFFLSLLPSAAHCLLVQKSKSSSTQANQRELHWVQTPAPGSRALRMTVMVGNASRLTLKDINCCNIYNSCKR